MNAPQSTLQRVADAATGGATVDVIAARLRLTSDLADAMIDELSRLGMVEQQAVPCGTCAPAAQRPVSCAGCPLAVTTSRAAHLRRSQ